MGARPQGPRQEPRSLPLRNLKSNFMKCIFADTSYWIALFNPRDELHDKAVAAAQKYSDDKMVTREMVRVEFLNGFSGRGQKFGLMHCVLADALRPGPHVLKLRVEVFNRFLNFRRCGIHRLEERLLL